MTEEQRLVEKLRRIEALFAGAATPGERDAAGFARERIRARLREQKQTDPLVEFSFKFHDQWSHRLFIALLRRYQIRPYRYRGQRRTTVMARVPKRFVDETLWPEFRELNQTLVEFLGVVTARVIADGIESNDSAVEEEPRPLSANSAGIEFGTA